MIHHPAAALSTTCGADGGPLTLSVSNDPSPSRSPFSLPSSRAPTRGSSANQSAFHQRGPSFRFRSEDRPVWAHRPLPPGQAETAGTTPVCLDALSRAGARPRRSRFHAGASAGRRSMASAIETDSEHDRGASRTPTTALTVARLHRSTPRFPEEHGCLWVARRLAERASRTWMGQGPASTPPTDTPAIARKRAFTPTHGVRTPPVTTSTYPGSLPERNRRPRLEIRRYRRLPEDRFVCLPAKDDRLHKPEVPSVLGYSVRSRETRCDPRPSAHLLPRRATAFDDNPLAHGPEESSA